LENGINACFQLSGPQELAFGNNSHCVNNLKLFGEMDEVVTKDYPQGKLKDLLDTHHIMRVMITGC
jgi:hypothetical protein